jgi:NAD(P)-dependent dehydrogenase (short-subunit alcohol dehydrogenase family)
MAKTVLIPGSSSGIGRATAEQLERQFRTNVFGVAAMIRHVLPIMRPQRSAL